MSSFDVEDGVVAGVGCLGCLLYIIYGFFMLAIWTFVGWAVLGWLGIVNTYPWETTIF